MVLIKYKEYYKMEKITDKNIYLAIDERIDRVVKQFNDKIKHMEENIDTIHDNTNSNLEEISNNKFKIDELENNFSKLFAMVDGLEATTKDEFPNIYIIKLNNRCDDLEAFKKRAEIIISKLVDKNDDLYETIKRVNDFDLIKKNKTEGK